MSPPPGHGLRAWLAIAVLAGCQEQETSLVFEVSGFFSRPQTLFAQLVDTSGARPAVYRAGSAAEPVTLPATVYIKASDRGSLLGTVIWLNDQAGSIIGFASTERCVQTTPHKQTRLPLSLGRSPNGWSPAQVINCRCYTDPTVAMCPPPQGVPPPLPPADAATEVPSLDAAPRLDASRD